MFIRRPWNDPLLQISILDKFPFSMTDTSFMNAPSKAASCIYLVYLYYYAHTEVLNLISMRGT